MKKKFLFKKSRRAMYFISLVFLVLSFSSAWATPAKNVQLAYNINTQTLHIEADHPTDRLERYFIQKVIVTKNSKETQVFRFPRQERPDKFIVDLEYPAVSADHLDVEFFSSEGGSVLVSMDVSKKGNI